jgi:hypothetical protein
MSSSDLVVMGRRAVLQNAPDFGPEPPTRIYVSGLQYKLVAPFIARPPLVNTIKIVLNWLMAGARFAKNIGYLQTGTGVDTTDTTFLKAVANQVMTSIAGSGLPALLHPQGVLQSVTAKDNGGTSESQATSDHAAIPGTALGNCLPPQCAVVWSWNIAASYRGGKPRWYIPAITDNAMVAAGNSQITPAYAGAFEVAGNAFESSINGSSPSSHAIILGTISYATHNAPRPTPIFRPFAICKVHERIDSQRRRSGKESLFPAVP